jgi:hypothetical protein
MPGVEQAIKLASTPSWDHGDPDAERGRDPEEHTERHPIEAAALRERNGRSRHPGTPGDIRLGQPVPDSDGTDGRSNAGLHTCSIALSPSPRHHPALPVEPSSPDRAGRSRLDAYRSRM